MQKNYLSFKSSSNVISKELIFFLSSIFAIAASILLTIYAKNTEKKIASNFLRLHVLANSNNFEDQTLKLRVRDKILAKTQEILSHSKSIENSRQILEDNIQTIEEIAKNEVINNGFDYDINLKIGNFLFPTKKYESIILPAGVYEALRVEIGEAKGNNWWCVIFPPFCLIEGIDISVPKNTLEEENSIDKETADLITVDKEDTRIKIKFKIVELLAPLFEKFREK